MKSLIVEGTSKTPEMVFYGDGRITLKGKSIPESAWKVFSPAIYWVSKITTEHVIFQIELEYINSASVVMMLEVLRTLEANKNVKSIVVEWCYEHDDEDAFDIGQIMQDSLGRSEFRFRKYRTSAS